jgi:hypothetical protein
MKACLNILALRHLPFALALAQAARQYCSMKAAFIVVVPLRWERTRMVPLTLRTAVAGSPTVVGVA